MTAAAHRHQQVVFTGEVHRVDHIGDARTLGDERRVVVKQRAGDRSRKFHMIGPSRHRPEPRPHEPGRRNVIYPRMKVIRPEHNVEPDLFGQHSLLNQELRLIRLVTTEPGEFHVFLSPLLEATTTRQLLGCWCWSPDYGSRRERSQPGHQMSAPRFHQFMEF